MPSLGPREGTFKAKRKHLFALEKAPFCPTKAFKKVFGRSKNRKNSFGYSSFPFFFVLLQANYYDDGKERCCSIVDSVHADRDAETYF